MKNEFSIFYSWENDRPGNNAYIRKVLEKSKKELKNDRVGIIIDSDSRDENGEKSIDESILKKIANCDFFLADITPVTKLHPSDDVTKEIPNANVMLELGYALANIGWERCILVWNTYFGAMNNAPFDIRNHITSGFCYDTDNKFEKKSLKLKEVISKKVARFDDIIANQQSSLGLKHDYQVYLHWEGIMSNAKVRQSLDYVVTNMRYLDNMIDGWDRLYCGYTANNEHHFLDQKLTVAFETFLKDLHDLAYFVALEFDPIIFKEESKPSTYKLRDYYKIYSNPEDIATKEHLAIEKVRELYKAAKTSTDNYRMVIAAKFGV